MSMKRSNVKAVMLNKSVKNKECIHRFVATDRKGTWSVKVHAMNGQNTKRKEKVSTTYFKCTICGLMTEYPDTWNNNYILSV